MYAIASLASVPLEPSESSITAERAEASDASAGSNGESPATVVVMSTVIPRSDNDCSRRPDCADAKESPEASRSSGGCWPMWTGSPTLKKRTVHCSPAKAPSVSVRSVRNTSISPTVSRACSTSRTTVADAFGRKGAVVRLSNDNVIPPTRSDKVEVETPRATACSG